MTATKQYNAALYAGVIIGTKPTKPKNKGFCRINPKFYQSKYDDRWSINPNSQDAQDASWLFGFIGCYVEIWLAVWFAVYTLFWFALSLCCATIFALT